MRLRWAFTILLLGSAAWADDDRQPPPDPAQGEPADSRSHAPSATDDALVVPRLLLTPPRLLWKAISYPVKAGGDALERHHLSERLFLLLTSPDGTIGVRPMFTYTLSFSPFFGLSFFDKKLLGPGTSFNVTLEGSAAYDSVIAHANARPTPARWWAQLDLGTQYIRRDDQLYTGIGEDVKPPFRASRYKINDFGIIANARFIVLPAVRLFAGGGFVLQRFGNGREIGDDPPIASVFCVQFINGHCIGGVDERLVPGFTNGTQFLRGHVGISVDTRDSGFKPSSGAMIDFAVDYSHGLGDDGSSYLRVHGSMTGVIDLWHRTHTLLLRVWGMSVANLSSTPIPFTQLVVLGGPDDLRGVRYGRFRGNSGTLFTAEYRWPVWMWMDASLFADAGGVFGQGWSGFSVSGLRPDVGAGIRVRTTSAFFMRLQTAWSPSDGWQFFFTATAVP